MEMSLAHIANCQTIAIMGGTFDPIHFGHLVTAEAVRDEFLIERVLFIPTGRPPHKTTKRVTDDEHRYLMTELATVDNPYFYTSRIEIDRPGETFTIDTITALRQICREDATVYFITGADAVNEILTWKNAETLLSLCHFVAVTRPGYNREKLFGDVLALNDHYKSRLHCLVVPALAISSTDVRNRVFMSKSIKYLVPESVEMYIMKHDLYKPDADLFDAGKMAAGVRERLSYKRFDHTMSVAEEAVKLAERHDCSPHEAYTAAIFHDCAKETPNDKIIQMCGNYGIETNDIIRAVPNLAHGALGAEIARREFGVENENVLNAIRFHTTGRARMTLLEKVIFLADMIEPSRSSKGYFHSLKRLAYEDNIDEAVFYGLQYKVASCAKRGIPVHPLGEEALAYYLKKRLNNPI